MSVGELLRQVEALPARERERFLLAVLKLETKASDAKPKSRRVKWPDIEARTKRIFGERVFPNLVLLERQEETIWPGMSYYADSSFLVSCYLNEVHGERLAAEARWSA